MKTEPKNMELYPSLWVKNTLGEETLNLGEARTGKKQQHSKHTDEMGITIIYRMIWTLWTTTRCFFMLLNYIWVGFIHNSYNPLICENPEILGEGERTPFGHIDGGFFRTWMSQEVSKWLGSMGYNLLINGVFLGVITH